MSHLTSAAAVLADPGMVSVVVPAYNEAGHLSRCLRSLAIQSLTPSEVIVVDDGSTDRTATIAAQAGACVISTPHRGPAHARNRGAAAARGDVLVFVDADIECSPTYVEQLVAPILDAGVIGTFSKEIYVGNLTSRWARAYADIRRLAVPRLLPDDYPDECANYRAVLRGRFLEVGGYEEVGYGEDMTLAPKLGAMATAAPGAVCWHYNPDSLVEIFTNARWIGRGHDIGEVRRPWRSNSPFRALAQGLREIAVGADPAIVPARLVYSFGILVGLIHRARKPERHWK
jgi:glycosyltransferase involved in cell wall biosynthesis